MKTTDPDFAGLVAFMPDLLPEEAIPLQGVMVVEYATAEGDTEHVYVTLGDQRIVQSLGLLEVGKFLLTQHMEEDDE